MKKLRAFVLVIFAILPLVFVGCKNTNKQKLSTPEELKASAGGIVRFKRVEDDEYYTISFNDYEVKVVIDSANPYVELYSQNNKNYVEYDASKILTLGESYNIKVKAQADKKQESDYSTSVSYTHSLPIDKPSNLKISDTVLTWDASQHASAYQVKVVTPNDKKIYDYTGNPIFGDDPDSISNADILSFELKNNRFDFSSILTDVGEYKFYVKAVSFNGVYSSSGFSYKTTYINQGKLKTPKINGLAMVNEYDESSETFVDNLHLTAVLDENSTAIEVVCDGLKQTQEITSAASAFSFSDNVININLNKFFGQALNLDATNTYTISLRSVDISPEGEKFYTNSELSDTITYSAQAKLGEVECAIEFDNLTGTNTLVWHADEKESEFIAGYKVYLMTRAGFKIHNFEREVGSLMLTEDVQSACVQAVGKGGYLSSSVSEPKSLLTREISASSLQMIHEGKSLIWTGLTGATYLVEVASEVKVLSEPSLEMSPYPKQDSIKITYMVPGYVPIAKQFSLQDFYPFKLQTPTIRTGQGFNSSNPYLLTFTGVDNAIGYYVYLTGKGMREPVKLPKVFTSTSINLAPYVTSAGEYSEYDVRIQAVADVYSAYSNSELTASGLLQVEHTHKLTSPEFLRNSFGEIAPVERVVSGDTTKYYLRFYGVESADSYEILVNFNKITQRNNLGNGLYRVDITNYLTSANDYTIMVRALVDDGAEYVKPSEYSVYNYRLKKKLDLVENIRVAENEGNYTLSFDLQEDAVYYRVRIAKVNDGAYEQFLLNNSLVNPLYVTGAVDITRYVSQAGEYHIYVTAIADRNGYYSDSDESTSFAKIDKLNTLVAPSELTYESISKDSFTLSWQAVEHADYYLVKVTEPNGQEREFSTYTNSVNINSCMTVQGRYTVNVKSMVDMSSTNSAYYMSSQFGDDYVIDYSYTEQHDYERYSVFMAGEYYDYVVENVQDLRGLLFYHYLYGVDREYSLNMYVLPKQGETIREAVLRFATEASDQQIYDFSSDETWLSQIEDGRENALFSYLCRKLLETYPEVGVLKDFSLVAHSNARPVFKVYYENALNQQKQTNTDLVYQAKDYGNDFKYLSKSSRRGVNSTFAIDLLPQIEVETSEQLLHAVINGRKPKFIGNSSVAEQIYSNAKKVLRAIANDSMTDLEKVTAIFDWIEHALNLNYYADCVYDSNNRVVVGSVADYGLRSEFYLEGLFLNLNSSSFGGYDGEFYLGTGLATNQLYAKAFSLLCGIEGIETVKVNGKITKINNDTTHTVNMLHTWNKVLIDLNGRKTWFAVDLTYSDNCVVAGDITRSYGTGAHTYFLVSDSVLQANFGYEIFGDSELPKADTIYNYYANSAFGLSADQIASTVNLSDGEVADFVYLKEFDPGSSYQKYEATQDYDQLQSYILNAMIYCKYQLKCNSNARSSFEFSVSTRDMGGLSLPSTHSIETITADFNRNYSKSGAENVLVKYHNIYSGETQKTTYVFTFEFIA